MRLDGERLILETETDTIVAADAGWMGSLDGRTEFCKRLGPEDLPFALGKWAAKDVLDGLMKIADSNITVASYLDSTIAKGYLALLTT